MSIVPRIALAVFFAVAVLSLLLLASPEPRTTSAQQPDYTAQCSNGIAIPDPQNNTGLVAGLRRAPRMEKSSYISSLGQLVRYHLNLRLGLHRLRISIAERITFGAG